MHCKLGTRIIMIQVLSTNLAVYKGNTPMFVGTMWDYLSMCVKKEDKRDNGDDTPIMHSQQRSEGMTLFFLGKRTTKQGEGLVGFFIFFYLTC